VLEAGLGVQAEESKRHPAGAPEFIETWSSASTKPPTPTRRLTGLSGSQPAASRRITRQKMGPKPNPGERTAPMTDSSPRSVPAWFVSLVHPEKTRRERPECDQRQTGVRC